MALYRYLLRESPLLNPLKVLDQLKSYEIESMKSAHQRLQEAVGKDVQQLQEAVDNAVMWSKRAAADNYPLNPLHIIFDGELHNQIVVAVRNSGDWTMQEHTLFLENLQIHGHEWHNYQIKNRIAGDAKWHFKDTAYMVFATLCENYPSPEMQLPGFKHHIDGTLRGHFDWFAEAHNLYIARRTNNIPLVEIAQDIHRSLSLVTMHDELIALEIFDIIRRFIL